MVMTRTRGRKQATLTFLAEQLVAVESELARLRAKQQEFEAKGEALRVAITQFDPEVDLSGIRAVPMDAPSQSDKDSLATP